MACDCVDSLLGNCCCGQRECLPPEPAQGPAGEVGPAGPSGSDGSDGRNSFTVSTLGFTVPAVNATVPITVAYGLFAIPGQNLYIQSAGVYTVVSTTSTTITASNTGAPGNASPGASIATNRLIGPDGHAGALLSPLPIASGGTGQANAIAAFNALSPLTTNGDTLVRESGSNTRKPIGTAGQIPISNGTVWDWGTNAPAATALTGQVPIANGGTSANTAAGARTALSIPGIATDNNFTGNNQFRIPVLGKFSVSNIPGSLDYLSVDLSTFTTNINDTLGNPVITATGASRIASGLWRMPTLDYTIASGSTYSTWTNSISIVVSTYTTTGAQTITLPAGTAKRIVTIVDGAGGASTNSITINRSGSDTILGATSYTINLNYGAVKLLYVSETTNWILLP